MVDIIKKAIFLPKEENRNAEKTGRVSRSFFTFLTILKEEKKYLRLGSGVRIIFIYL